MVGFVDAEPLVVDLLVLSRGLQDLQPFVKLINEGLIPLVDGESIAPRRKPDGARLEIGQPALGDDVLPIDLRKQQRGVVLSRCEQPQHVIYIDDRDDP